MSENDQYQYENHEEENGNHNDYENEETVSNSSVVNFI